MCGRYASFLSPEAIRTLFGTRNPLVNLPPSWNVAPSQPAMVVRRHPQSGDRHLDLLRWGLVPHWEKDLRTARKPINARAETAIASRVFRGAFATRRCLVPADAFYEWRPTPFGKQPYAIARRDGAPMAFAGLWESWRSPEGEAVRTFVILTTAANATMAALHDRMPVLVEEQDWPTWLGEVEVAPATLMRPAADDVLYVWQVSRAVNSVRNNGPELLDTIEDPAAPPPSEAPAGPNPA